MALACMVAKACARLEASSPFGAAFASPARRSLPSFGQDDKLRKSGRAHERRSGKDFTSRRTRHQARADRLALLRCRPVWLARPQADPHDGAPRRKPEKYAVPLPTIGESRRSGVVTCDVQCAGPNCWHQVRFTFDQ